MADIMRKRNELASDIGETTEVSWSPPKNLSYETWEQIGNTLQTINGAVNWWIGDWLNVGERKWGDTYTQAINTTDASIESLKKYKAVSERIDKSIRVPELSWTHHFHVAYIPEEQRGPLLAIAEYYELSSRELKALVGRTTQERSDVIDAFLANGPEAAYDAFSALLAATIDKPVYELQKPVEVSEYQDGGYESLENTTECDFAAQNEDYDEPLPFTDPPEPEIVYEEDDDEVRDFITDFFEEHEIFIVDTARNFMEFDNGLRVIAEVDEKGEAILLWQLP